MLAQKLLAASGTTRTAQLQAQATSATPATTFTFASQYIGNAGADRVVVVAVYGTDATAKTISRVTIGGVSATLATQNSSFTKITGIYYLTVASGTAADVEVTFSGTTDECFIGVYSLEGWGTVTLYDSGSATGSAVTGISVSGIDTAANGCQINIATTGPVVLNIFVPSGAIADTYAISAGMTVRSTRLWSTPAATGANVVATSASATDHSLSVATFS